MKYHYYVYKRIEFIIDNEIYELEKDEYRQGHNFYMNYETNEPIMNDYDKETKIKNFVEYKKRVFKEYMMPDKILYDDKK
uniref:Uncharacterized protein n=1 Tax=viral metagenome TaxID=1070528 RepID=A0A6C0H5B6_9ZZZZ